MEFHITALFTGILGLLFFLLSIRTILMRGAARIAIGDGDHEELHRRIRVHANFAEYVPLLLIVLLLLENSGLPEGYVYLCGSAVVVGRLSHAYGLSSSAAPGSMRQLGMHLTLWPLFFGSGYLLILGASRWLAW